MKIQAPIEVEIKIHITSDATGQSGVATLGMGKGRYFSEQELREAVAQFVEKDMPAGFRLMTKREYWDTLMPPAYEEDEDGELQPMRFAVPGGPEYEP